MDTIERTPGAPSDVARARTVAAPEHPLIPHAAGLQDGWPAEGVSGAAHRRAPLGFLKELPFLIVIAFTLAVLMKTFLIQAFYIPSESMEPTLHGCAGCSGDRVLVNKLAYRFREPRRGEIIVFIETPGVEDHSVLGRIKHFFSEGIGAFNASETDYIKRIIGLPGETIQVTEKGVYITPVNGKKFRLREPYIFSSQEQGSVYGPKKVPADSYFVMGDNRANSRDSRFIGPVMRSRIIGRAFVKIWPLGRAGLLQRPCYPSRLPHVTCPPVAPAKPAQSLPFAPTLPPLVAMMGAMEFRRRGRAAERPAA